MELARLARLGLIIALSLVAPACSSGISDVAPAADDATTDGTTHDSIAGKDDGIGDVGASDSTVDDGSSTDGTAGDVTPHRDAPGADSGGGACGAATDPTCGGGLNCCDGACKNLENDPLDCGKCGNVCTGAKSMCLGGTCQIPTCVPTCGEGEVCCSVPGPGPLRAPSCLPGITCPVGCPLCK